MKKIILNRVPVLLFVLLTSFNLNIKSEDGYQLWLRYNKIENDSILQYYHGLIKGTVFPATSQTLEAARSEMITGLRGLLAKDIPIFDSYEEGMVVVGTPKSLSFIQSLNLHNDLKELGDEGYLIRNMQYKGKNLIILTSNSDIGILYGVFHILRLIQTHKYFIDEGEILSVPRIKYRLLNHWDNLDRSVERGYAGLSLWEWDKLPDEVSPRYNNYARANASIGINGTVLTNVNADAKILTGEYIRKVSVLADVFRPYGIKVYLTARFSAPIELDGMSTADPLDSNVIKWWQNKADTIYKYIPDFGGFLVKDNSEGQPGPQDFGRTHVDGANMLANALDGRGIVMWRAFVYNYKGSDDRSKQAYLEFQPLDGQFNEKVFIQVKNGPIDFQPREPFHPLFGAMPKTSLMVEFQITQEYLGQGTHLVYLAPLFKECLYSDTYAKGKGSYVANIIDGTLDEHYLTGMAGVANTGSDRNWTGHHFGQANWYAFGRLAWDHSLTPEEIADEWIRMTFTTREDFITPVKKMMLDSREITVNYMVPLGLHHQMGMGHHYGPGPWVVASRPDWSSTYYHRADSIGIGFNRTKNGSKAVMQYYPPVREIYNDPHSCPNELLLWFHHLPWNYQINSERNLWEELCYRYYTAAESVKLMQETWNSIEGIIDNERFMHVKKMLNIQAKESIWWRNAMLLYFQSFSKLPIPSVYEKPDKTLEYYMQLKFPDKK